MSFLSPLLLWGMLLGSIPIIIHLLNRRRFRRVEWAPMHYLKLTIQRNRRRIELEQLILLLMRVAALVLLFFFLARPIANATGLEKWFQVGGRSSHVVVIDDSASMHYASGGESSLHRARQAASALLDSVRPQDRFTLLLSSAPTQPLLNEVEGVNRDDILAAVSSIAGSETHTDWPGAFEAVDQALRSCTYPTRQLTIVTDMRRAGWSDAVRPVCERWESEEILLRIVDVGSDDTGNLSLQAIEPGDRTVLAGTQSPWQATVRNNSAKTIAGAKALLFVDDQPTQLPLPDIAAGATVQFPFTAQFPSGGPHHLSLQLPDDDFVSDNRRWVAVAVRDSLLIRLVDGQPSSVPFGGEVDYLAAPMAIGVGNADAWRVEVATEEDFLSPRRETPDLMVLANVAAPTAEQCQRLRDLVRQGMGLMIFTGDQIDIGHYNQTLFDDGRGLMPMKLRTLLDQEIRGVLVENIQPTPLEKLLELKPTALERVACRQIMAVEQPESPDDSVRVLARWNDPQRSPAVVEKLFGQGRVLLWTTTADRAGSDWPIEPSFVLAVREAVRGVAPPTSRDNTVSAGDRLRRQVRTSQQITNVTLLSPIQDEPQSLAAVPVEESEPAGEPAFDIVLPDTRRAGLYALAWEQGSLGPQQDYFAVNTDVRECELARIESEELKKLLLPMDVEIVAAREDDTRGFSATGNEMWRQLAWGLLALLVCESLFATWVGRAR